MTQQHLTRRWGIRPLHFKSFWVTGLAAIHSHRVMDVCTGQLLLAWQWHGLSHLQGRLEHDDVAGRLDPGLPVHVHRQLRVGVNLDMASLQEFCWKITMWIY